MSNHNPCKKRSNCCERECTRENEYENNENHEKIFCEFIRTFIFSNNVQLPIVQPGGSLIFPTSTVQPNNVIYVESVNRTGLIVPRGTYLVSWTLNPGDGAIVDLLVNGNKPIASNLFPYAESVMVGGVLNASYLIQAPLRGDNLISLVNGGSALFTLNDIPNTKIGNTSILTQIRVQRL